MDRRIITFEQLLNCREQTHNHVYTNEEIKADFDNLPSAEPIIRAAKRHARYRSACLMIDGQKPSEEDIQRTSALEAVGEKI